MKIEKKLKIERVRVIARVKSKRDVLKHPQPWYCPFDTCAHVGTTFCELCIPTDIHCSHFTPKIGGDVNGS